MDSILIASDQGIYDNSQDPRGRREYLKARNP
jgi:hypothetical protein